MCVHACRLVHDDVFQVMKYSFEESLAPDVAQKCLDFWYAFVEPFFGLPPRPKEQAIKVGLGWSVLARLSPHVKRSAIVCHMEDLRGL